MRVETLPGVRGVGTGMPPTVAQPAGPTPEEVRLLRLTRRVLWWEDWQKRPSHPARVPVFHPRHLEAKRLRIHWVRPARVDALLAMGFGVYMGRV